MRKYIYIIFTLLFFSFGRAQTGSLIIDKNEIFVGEKVMLTYHLMSIFLMMSFLGGGKDKKSHMMLLFSQIRFIVL